MGKIIVGELLKLAEAGKTGVEMAAHFGVSTAAISKSLARHRGSSAPEPESFHRLSEGKKRFVIERAKGRSKTDSAMTAFECKDRTSAKTIGCRLDKDPDIANSLADILYQSGAGRRRRMERLVDVIESKNLAEACRGIELAARVCGEMAPERVQVGLSPQDIRDLIASLPDAIPEPQEMPGIIDITPPA